MRVWYFSEMAYPLAWNEGLKRGSLRVVLPNSNYDPAIGHTLLNRHLDEFALCDEVGLDIMVNEHHSTSTCLTISVPMALAILARETKHARLLSLGTPIANRPDPVRVAEEMAWLDVLSGGRLEMGLVKGAPYEIAPANSNPANLMRRYWEAHDLILKAMSTTDGPFNWEGEFFHYRNVNIWPRPFQQPTPPVWMTGLSLDTGRMAAERGHVLGTLLSGSGAGPMFDAYRTRAQELGWTAGPDRFAYAAVVGVGATRAEGLRRADIAADYVRTAPLVLEPFTNPPGYNSIAANVAALKGKRGGFVRDRQGNPIDQTTATIEQFVEAGTAFAGTPDDVYDQIKALNDQVGGFGHLLMFGQGGKLDHADTVANITLFAQEVMPRLRELNPAPRQSPSVAAQ
ncbi:MAG TPA: LLM class flavin-dependent oxidoreductase [Candidatus Sulfotelmatobacter sp.]|nr:LLM class flavin-dependent oxidoreductase [Candidatus Sulfotelmatobacter sp.]